MILEIIETITVVYVIGGIAAFMLQTYSKDVQEELDERDIENKKIFILIVSFLSWYVVLMLCIDFIRNAKQKK